MDWTQHHKWKEQDFEGHNNDDDDDDDDDDNNNNNEYCLTRVTPNSISTDKDNIKEEMER